MPGREPTSSIAYVDESYSHGIYTVTAVALPGSGCACSTARSRR